MTKNCLYVALDHNKACENKRILTLKTGTLLFTGTGNSCNIGADIYKNIIGTTSKEIGFNPEEYDLTETTILTYCMPVLNETILHYSRTAGGDVLIGKLKKDIDLYIFTTSMCEVFYNTREDYSSSSAQCFCKDKTHGYANCIYNISANPYALTDIMVCDAYDVIKPMCTLNNENAGKFKMAVETNRPFIIEFDRPGTKLCKEIEEENSKLAKESGQKKPEEQNSKPAKESKKKKPEEQNSKPAKESEKKKPEEQKPEDIEFINGLVCDARDQRKQLEETFRERCSSKNDSAVQSKYITFGPVSKNSKNV